jgi:hypothetical protein
MPDISYCAVTQVTPDDNKERKADRHVQLWAAAIGALGGIVASAVTLVGGLLATDSRIVPVSETTPTAIRTVTVAPTATVTETAPGGGGGVGSTPGPNEPSPSRTVFNVNWETSGRNIAQIGTVLAMDCPARGVLQDIWGDRLYLSDSSICTAAVHDGRIKAEPGGRVVILIREGAKFYPSARRNGITSGESTRGNIGSFEFLPPR